MWVERKTENEVTEVENAVTDLKTEMIDLLQSMKKKNLTLVAESVITCASLLLSLYCQFSRLVFDESESK